MLFMLMLSITAGHFLKKSGHKYLQEAGLTVLIGMLIGACLSLLSVEAYVTDLSNHFSNIFMILLLPPIIFESGYNMKKKYFFKNIGTVLLYAFVGTFIAIFTSAVGFYYVGQTSLSPDFTWKEAFAFGSLISATDPVSVLAIFKEMNADMNLYTIVFGESIFNDAVAIVMYQTVLQAGSNGLSTGQEIANSIGQFILIFTGSLVIGAVSALLSAFVLKRQKSTGLRRQISEASVSEQEQHHAEEVLKQEVMTEITMMLLCPWVSYLIAEGLELSGICAILTNGVALNYYATPNISPAAKKVIAMGYETIAYSAETLVFLFLGIGLFAFKHPFKELGWGLFVTTILNLNFARLLNVSVVTWIVNRTRGKTKINSKEFFVIWFSGLRGAMAYALALSAVNDFPIGSIMLIDTLLYSFLTILIQGSILNPVLTKCDVKQKPGNELEDGEFGGRPENCCNRFKRRISMFDRTTFAPLFIKSQAQIERRAESVSSVFQLDDQLETAPQHNALDSDSPQDPFSLNAPSDKVGAGEE